MADSGSNAKVSINDLYVAAEWLDVNEGEEGETHSCHRVSDWLRREAARRENEKIIREIARERLLPISKVRVAFRARKSD